MEISAHTTLKNSSYTIIGYSWSMLFALLITPIIVFKLGVKDYGVLIFINTILTFMNLLDLGIGTSTIKHIAEYYSTKQTEKLKSLIYSMNTIFLIIGTIGLLVFVIASILLPNFFRTSEVYNYSAIFLLAGLSFFISSATSVFNSIPNALQRFDISTKIGLVVGTLTNLSSLLLVLLDYRLMAIIINQIVFAGISFIVLNIYSQRLLSISCFRYGWSKNEVIKSYKFGLASTISGFAGMSLTYLDRLIIPLFLGPTQLTYYSLPGGITTRIPGVTGSLSSVIFPATVSLNSTNDKEKLKRLYIRSFRLLTIISCAISISIIFLADKILLYWLNDNFADKSTQVLIILALTNLIISLSNPIVGFLQALGKFRFLTGISLFMVSLNVILLFILLPRYGINGAAWAYLLAMIPAGYMFYYTETKYLELKNRHIFYFSQFLKLTTATTLFFLIVHFLIYPLVINLFTLVILGPTSVLLFLGLYWLLGFYEKEDLHDISLFGQKIILKLKK